MVRDVKKLRLTDITLLLILRGNSFVSASRSKHGAHSPLSGPQTP